MKEFDREDLKNMLLHMINWGCSQLIKEFKKKEDTNDWQISDEIIDLICLLYPILKIAKVEFPQAEQLYKDIETLYKGYTKFKIIKTCECKGCNIVIH